MFVARGRVMPFLCELIFSSLFFFFRRMYYEIDHKICRCQRLVYRWKPCHSLLYNLIWVSLNRETKIKSNRISTVFNHSTNRRHATSKSNPIQLSTTRRRQEAVNGNKKSQELHNIFLISRLIRFFFSSSFVRILRILVVAIGE